MNDDQNARKQGFESAVVLVLAVAVFCLVVGALVVMIGHAESGLAMAISIHP